LNFIIYRKWKNKWKAKPKIKSKSNNSSNMLKILFIPHQWSVLLKLWSAWSFRTLMKKNLRTINIMKTLLKILNLIIMAQFYHFGDSQRKKVEENM
jgi:hypothetical protein